ncbi:FG-GAP-like repeat-containing protein [Engelhardtia mirabilis]
MGNHHSTRSSLRPFAGIVVPLLLLGASANLASCGKTEPQPKVGDPTGAVLTARERAAALFAEERLREAREALEPLVTLERPDPTDLLRAGILDLELGGSFTAGREELTARALESLELVTALLPEDPAAFYVLGQYYYDFDFELAEPYARRAYELAPDDPPTAILYGKLLTDLAYDMEPAQADATLAEAEQVFERLLDQGVEFLGSWTLIALSNYANLLLELERIDDSANARDRARTLEDRGLTRPSTTQIRRGDLGALLFPQPQGSVARPRNDLEPGTAAAASFPAGLRSLRALTLSERAHPISIADVDENLTPDRDYEGRPAGTVQVDAHLDPQQLVGDDGRALWLMRPSEDGAWRGSVIVPAEGDGEIEAWEAIDLGEDRGERELFEGLSQGRPYAKGLPGSRDGVQRSDLELAVARAGVVELWQWSAPAASYSPRLEPIASYPGRCESLVTCDVDHDGDLDLILAGDFGARLLRNDGAEGSGGFTDATQQLGLHASAKFTWVIPEDFDSDADVDLLFGGPAGAFLASSDRSERWSDASAKLPASASWARAPLVADFDADGFCDLWLPTSGKLFVNSYGERFISGDAPAFPAPADARPQAVDIDLDGAWDVVWTDAKGLLQGELALAFDRRAALDPIQVGTGHFVISDLDRDCNHEVASAGGEQIVRLAGCQGVQVGFKGVKDNPRGVGGILHVRAGDLYTRRYLRGEPVLVGAGERETLDVVRMVWPNGVIQSELDVGLCGRRVLEQIEGLIGSCPFLYTWNGTTYEFVTDVIGITPLGLPMAPGQLVPPDHDEYVLVRGEQLVPKDGFLELQFTEELREVTYLDQAELIAVDHPVGTEVFPDERFTFPPFPTPHTHTVERLALPIRAVDDRGNDWTASLAAQDMDLAKPFVPHRGQFMGLAAPHALELEFDPADLEGAEGLRLLMCGWLYWTDASVNVAAARHPGYEFIPPILQVPDGQGGWRDAGPPIGFPAGKTKTMVVDVAGILDPADPRIRIFSTLRLYWDAIRLATCGDDTERVETRIAASSAKLWERGFSCPIYLDGDERLEWFEWDNTECTPRWNQHPGDYTRFGDVLPLVESVDDMFVILGAGDALTLRFDAAKLPELREGWRRDYLLFLDGWAKDRDPNTYEALYVEPLPFHAMSGYPYGADEHFPDSPAHREYQRTWNTRPAKRWIEPLASPSLRR